VPSSSITNRSLIAFCAAALLFVPASLRAQGFGGFGGIKKAKEVTLKRILPASVNLNQKRIKVLAVGASKQIPEDLLTVLKTKLVTAIQKDNRFLVDERNPETLLHFMVTNYYVESRSTQAGNATCKFFTGKIEASYQAIDVAKDAPLDSENLIATAQEEPKRSQGAVTTLLKGAVNPCGTNAKATENEARDALVDSIVMQMAQRAAPSEGTLVVPVPGGKLEPLSALAISQRWGKLLEEAQKADKLPKPEDDAYRLYLVGLANEALAYENTRDAAESEKTRGADVTSDKAKQAIAQEEADFNQAESYLDKAAKAYKDALQGKPGEKEFRDPDDRMEGAVKLYATISRHKQEYIKAVADKAQEHKATETGTRSSGATADPAPAGGFNQVIGMCQDHVADISQLIKDHPTELKFDKGLTLNEELRVKKECGADSKAILDEIKAQVAGKPATAKPPVTKK
jgi:hypothetical protein